MCRSALPPADHERTYRPIEDSAVHAILTVPSLPSTIEDARSTRLSRSHHTTRSRRSELSFAPPPTPHDHHHRRRDAGTLGIRDLAAYGRHRFDPGFSYVLSLVLSFTFFLCGRIALSVPGNEGG